MKITSFEQMEAFVKSHAGRKKIAVACAHDDVTLEAVLMAVDKGVADAVLIGKQAEIEALLRQFGKDPLLRSSTRPTSAPPSTRRWLWCARAPRTSP